MNAFRAARKGGAARRRAVRLFRSRQCAHERGLDRPRGQRDGRADRRKGPLPAARRPIRTSDSRPRNARRAVGGPLDPGPYARSHVPHCCRGKRIGIFAGSGVGSRCCSRCWAQRSRRRLGIRLVRRTRPRGQEFLQDESRRGTGSRARSSSSDSARRAERRRPVTSRFAIAEYFETRQGWDGDADRSRASRCAVARSASRPRAADPEGISADGVHGKPRLLERAGPAPRPAPSRASSPCCWSTATTTNAAVSDAVRSTLDGNIVMQRAIAERGRYRRSTY